VEFLLSKRAIEVNKKNLEGKYPKDLANSEIAGLFENHELFTPENEWKLEIVQTEGETLKELFQKPPKKKMVWVSI